MLLSSGSRLRREFSTLLQQPGHGGDCAQRICFKLHCPGLATLNMPQVRAPSPALFPGALRPAGDMSSCDAADFKVKPRAGDAVLFWSLNHDLTVNPRALHGACPVVKGEK